MKNLKSTSTISIATSNNRDETAIRTKRTRLPKSKFTRDLIKNRIAKQEMRREIMEGYGWDDELAQLIVEMNLLHYNPMSWLEYDDYRFGDGYVGHFYGYGHHVGHECYGARYDDFDYHFYGSYDADGYAGDFDYDSYYDRAEVGTYRSYSDKVFNKSGVCDDHCRIDSWNGFNHAEEEEDSSNVFDSDYADDEHKPIFERPRFSTERFVLRPGRKVRFKKNKEQRGGNRRFDRWTDQRKSGKSDDASRANLQIIEALME